MPIEPTAPQYIVPGSAFSGHDLVMFPETSVPQYWQRLCGEPLTNGHIVLEVTSQWLFIEALRQGLGVGMMAKEIVQRCCPELVNVMPARSESVDIWLVVNPDVCSAPTFTNTKNPGPTL